MEFIVREYRAQDAAATMRVFRRAVLGTASRDYDAVQTRVWADRTGSPAGWNARRLAAHTWVAVPVGPVHDAGRTVDGESCDASYDAVSSGIRGSAASGEPVGFIDVDDDGHIDMLFVDPPYGRRGVASRLLSQVERFAADRGIAGLYVHASVTAQPFFARHGFRTVEERHPTIGNVMFVNYLMVRP